MNFFVADSSMGSPERAKNAERTPAGVERITKFENEVTAMADQLNLRSQTRFPGFGSLNRSGFSLSSTYVPALSILSVWR
jgi:hypothetical protein